MICLYGDIRGFTFLQGLSSLCPKRFESKSRPAAWVMHHAQSVQTLRFVVAYDWLPGGQSQCPFYFKLIKPMPVVEQERLIIDSALKKELLFKAAIKM